jgi:putative hydrolase of the HAD superfamily
MKIENITDIFFWFRSYIGFLKTSDFSLKYLSVSSGDSAKDFIKYVPINQACWQLYQYDKITHEELRYKVKVSLML